MGGFEHATPGMILIMVLVGWALLHELRLVRGGKIRPVRRIPGIDAIEEATGRPAELGKPLSFSTGLAQVGPVLYACLGVLQYVAKRCATLRTRLIVPQNSPEAMAVVEDTVREAYRSSGRGAQFDPATIVFLSDEQFAFAAGYMGLIHREQVGSAFLFGTFAAESLVLAEAGQQVGAMQVAASVSPEQVAFFVSTCDYTLIGEELFAASAYLSQDPVQLSSLRTQDVIKMIVLIIILTGAAIATLRGAGIYSFEKNLDQLILLGWGDLQRLLGL